MGTEYFIYTLLGMTIGYVLDLIFGDPNVRWHPIRLIGKLIAGVEKALYISDGEDKDVNEGISLNNKKDEYESNKVNHDIRDVDITGNEGLNADSENNNYNKIDEYNSDKKLFRSGVRLVIIVIAVVAVIVGTVRFVAWLVHPVCFMAVEAVLVWLSLAQTSLRKESMKVYDALQHGDVEKARHAVSMIVGRDTEVLDEAGITRAAVETVAENTSDGITAPLFYTALLGSFGGYIYKAVNTMDSMVGYKNDRYMYFGRCAARLDDVANFIPSRLSAALMIAASYLLGYDYKGARRIFRRDRFKHASPNSAQTESVCAGALGLRLAGDAWYGGVLFKKEFIGDAGREIESEDIKRACRLSFVTGVESYVLAALFTGIVCVIAGCF